MGYPLDIVPGAALSWSVRKTRSAYAGNCVSARNGSGTNANIGFSSDWINWDALETHLAAGSATSRGLLNSWYDQSGNNRHGVLNTDPNPDVDPGAIILAADGMPCCQFFGPQQKGDTSPRDCGAQIRNNFGSLAQPFTIMTVFQAVTQVNGLSSWASVHTDGTGFRCFILIRPSTDRNVSIFSGTAEMFVQNAFDGPEDRLVVIGCFNGASSWLKVNGVTTTGVNIGTTGFSNGTYLPGGINGAHMNVHEHNIWFSALTQGQGDLLMADAMATFPIGAVLPPSEGGGGSIFGSDIIGVGL